METKALAELAKYFNILDAVAICATYFITQRVKELVPPKVRPIMAILVGIILAGVWAGAFGGLRMIGFFGIVYGAGAIFLYEAGFHSIVTKASEKIKGMIGNGK